jgi:hypothetical protein
MADEVIEDLDSLNETTEEVENTESIEETTADVDTEDTSALKQELARKEESRQILYKRAKEAEAEVRRLKAEPPKAEAQNSSTKDSALQRNESPDAVDEKILRATKGYDDEAIAELKFIAERESISLFAAEQDKRFVRYQAIVDEEKKKAEASLGGSKGSARKKAEPSFSDPGITSDQHRDLAAKYGIK